MGAQRIIFFTIVAALLVAIGLHYNGGPSEKDALHVCTWSNYFPDDIIHEFTQKTGTKVELSYVSSNEELFAKLKAGATGFDIILPSDYMVRQMTDLKMLRELDPERLPNLKYLDAFYRNLPYDPGMRHSVPFTWGTTGIAVNTEKVPLPPGPVSWGLLFHSPDPRHTSVLDDMREVFGAALLWRGKPLDVGDPALLAAAKNDILAMKNRILMFTSEPKPLLLNGELNIAHVFSVDAAQAHSENPEIKYFIPQEGATLWTDNFAIPVSSVKATQALGFINYFLDPANAYRLVKQNHLATPNEATKKRLIEEKLVDPSFYPSREVMQRLHFLDNDPRVLPLMNRMWTELKT